MGSMGICCDELCLSKCQAEVLVFMHIDILNQSFSQPTRATRLLIVSSVEIYMFTFESFSL